MQTKEPPLFTLELRIQKKTVKLRVNLADTLSGLVIKLVNQTNLPQRYMGKVQEKLEAGLLSMAENTTCSTKVQNKLQSLTQECQIVILGVSESEPVELSLDETPFNVLLETPGKLSKGSTSQGKRNYLQSGQGSQALKRSYNQPPSQLKYQRQNIQNYKCYPNHKRMAAFSGVPYKQTSSNYQSPQKQFKRYGINPLQISESYGLSFGSLDNVNGYHVYSDRRQKSDVEDQVSHKDFGLLQYDNRPFAKKPNHTIEIYRPQVNKNQDKLRKQSCIQYPNREYGAHQRNLSMVDLFSKIHVSQQGINVFGGRFPEDRNGKVDKKFSYLQSS